ncbi:MAG: hypothetical protein HYV75_03590, partial [Opitutae bacterium]|nr:hypothetical protein [Opitutae bacterium]
GQWNNLLEITLNAVLLAGATGLLVATVAPALGRFPAVVLALGAGTVSALPYSWENTLFGAQINLVCEIGFSLCYMRAMARGTHCSPAWWLGQLAAGLVLLTQRSGVLVLAPVAGLHLWRLARPGVSRRTDLAGLAMVGVWVLVFFQISPPFEETGGMKADSWRIILD